MPRTTRVDLEALHNVYNEAVEEKSSLEKCEDLVPSPLDVLECFETMKVKDGKILHLDYHQQRVDNTRDFFAFSNKLDLKESIFDLPQKGEFKLRVDYSKSIKHYTCKEFTCREFKEFKIVNSDIEYRYKYTNRYELENLKKDSKEIIIVKNGFLRDTTIANIALYIEGVWMTPRIPLLKGTTRARLLENGFLVCKDLTITDLEKTEKFAIINALIGFHTVKEAKIEFELGFKRTI